LKYRHSFKDCANRALCGAPDELKRAKLAIQKQENNIRPIYRDLTNDELIEKFAEMDYYDPDLCALICERAGLTERWEHADGDAYGSGFRDGDGENFDSVLCLAIEKLTGA
jgi:hypothetical protein